MKRSLWLGLLYMAMFLAFVGVRKSAAQSPAKDCVNCAPKAQLAPQSKELNKLATLVPCPSEDERAQKKADEEFKKWFPAKKTETSRKIGPYILTGTEEQLQLAEAILEGKPHSKWPGVAAGCKTVLCALGKLFGSEEAAKRALVIGRRNGYIVSVDQQFNHFRKKTPNERMWSVSEIRAMDDTLAAAPAELNRLPHMKYFYRVSDTAKEYFARKWREMQRGLISDEEAKEYKPLGKNVVGAALAKAYLFKGQDESRTELEGSILLFDNLFHDENGKKPELKSIATSIIHELCHHWDYGGFYSPRKVQWSELEDFGFATNSWEWKKEQVLNPKTQNLEWTEPKWVRKESTVFLTPHAAESTFEDFAEVCAYYVADPKSALKAMTAEKKTDLAAKYAFIQAKVFGGKEFWSKPPLSPAPWPQLEATLKDGALCSEVFNRCASKISEKADGSIVEIVEMLTDSSYARRSWRYKGGRSHFWAQGECAKEEKKEILSHLIKQLQASESDFCEQGGEMRIQEAFEEYCKQWIVAPASSESISPSPVPSADPSSDAPKKPVEQSLDEIKKQGVFIIHEEQNAEPVQKPEQVQKPKPALKSEPVQKPEPARKPPQPKKRNQARARVPSAMSPDKSDIFRKMWLKQIEVSQAHPGSSRPLTGHQ